MKQVKALPLLFLCTIAMTLHINAVSKKGTKIVSAQQTNIQSVNADNDALMTIVENSKNLVKQIQNGNRSVAEKNQALKNITQAEEGLFSDIKDLLQSHIAVIKKEVEAFFKHTKKPLVKYDDRKAVAALSDLALDVEKLVETSANDIVTTAQKDIEEAAIVTEQIKTGATRVINQINEQLASGEITPVYAVREIAQQNKIISLADKRLKDLVKLTASAVKAGDAQATYLSQFLAPFQAGYFSTQEEKDFAREMIDAKEQEKKELDALRAQVMGNANVTEDKKAEFEVYYAEAMLALNDEIKQQKIITGDEWSNNRKAFWGTVGLIGAAGTAWLAGQYFSAPIVSVEPEVDKKLDAAIAQQRDLETEAIIVAEQVEQARLVKEKEKQELDVAISQQSNLETDAIIAAQQAEQARLVKEQEEQKLDAAISQQSNLETDAIIAAQQAEQARLVKEQEEQKLDAAIAQQDDLETDAIIAAQQAEQARLVKEKEKQELDAAIAQQDDLETDAIIAAQQAEQARLVKEKEKQELDVAIAQQGDLETDAIVAAQAKTE